MNELVSDDGNLGPSGCGGPALLAHHVTVTLLEQLVGCETRQTR
jgi:hypothetical protein